MNPELYQLTAARIREEFGDLDRVALRLPRTLELAASQPQDEELFLDAAALNLHDLYGGLERLFEAVATNIDRSLPSGASWHRDLLAQMCLAVGSLRPAVLSRETRAGLEELLSFRHRVRHAYSFDLDRARVAALVALVEDGYPRWRTELFVFADHLERAAEA